MEEPAAAVQPRLPGLDLLRAIAIGWVMIYHGRLYDLVSPGAWVVDFGWMGVDLFFVLSGYLIAGQLLKPWARGERPDYGRFFSRRLLRTLPAYLAVVAMYFLVPALRDRVDIQPLWRFLTFTQNFGLNPSPPKAFSHAWSLCVEEQFYLLFPLAVAVLARRPTPAKIIGAILAALIFGMALRGWLWLHDVAARPFDPGAPPRGPYMTLIYYPTWTRLDGLLAGIAAAALHAFRPAIWSRLTYRPNLLLATGVLGVGASIVFFHNQIPGFLPTVLGYPLLSFSLALTVMAGAEPRSVIGRYPVPGAGALAAGSYSLYLSHKMVFHAVAAAADRLPPALHDLRLALAISGASIVGAALYWGVERPFLKLRDRLDRMPRVALATA